MAYMVNPSREGDIERADDEFGEQGIDLVAVVVALLAEWKLALIVFVIVSGAGLAYINTLQPEYVATATFLPKGGNTEAASLATIFQASGPGNLYLGLLHSRSVLDDVVDRQHLMQLWKTGSREYARGMLQRRTTLTQGTDSIITISVREKDARDAARIANGYLDGLQDLSDKMARSQGAQTRKFFDRQLDEEQVALDKAEDELAQRQVRSGQVAPETQAAVGIGNIAGLRGQIVGLQVQLSTLLQSEADTNPEVVRLRAQIAALQAQERIQEVGGGPTPVGAPIPAASIPKTQIANARAQRDVQSHAARVAALTSQYGSARLDQEFSHAAFEIIDQAIPPEGRAWPPREPYQYAAIGFGLVAAFFAVLLKLMARRVFGSVEYRAMFRRLRGAL